MARTFYDEMYDASGAVRPHYREFARWLAEGKRVRDALGS